MRLIGNWSKPIDAVKHKLLCSKVALRQSGCCAFCGYKSPITSTFPTGNMEVCLTREGLAIEESNAIALCGVCHHFNSFDSLLVEGKPLGMFVELPYFTQGELVNLQRILYCIAMSKNEKVTNHPLYHASSALIKNLTKIPDDWQKNDFDGSVSTLKHAVEHYTGHVKPVEGKVLYVDRLRFSFNPQYFKSHLEYWLPQIESQLMAGD